MAVEDFRKKGIATAHDVAILNHLAWILTGGDADLIEPVAQSAILDLEHQAFMKLIRLKKTQLRIKHVLDTGKPLRN
jgi:3-hydroxyacyl-CoA dehydrogenase